MFGCFSFNFLHILCSGCFFSFVTLNHLVGLTNLEFVVVVIVIICLESVVYLVFCSLNWIQIWSFLLLWLFVSWCFFLLLLLFWLQVGSCVLLMDDGF